MKDWKVLILEKNKKSIKIMEKNMSDFEQGINKGIIIGLEAAMEMLNTFADKETLKEVLKSRIELRQKEDAQTSN